MIVLHAVVGLREGETRLAGLPVRPAGRLGVLHQPAAARPPSDRPAVIAHGRRLAALAEERPVLPMRYGTVVPAVDDLDELIAERHTTWARRLAAVEGRCELLVHLVPADSPYLAERPPSGREYLARRAAAVRREEEVRDELERLVRPWACELRRLPDGRRLAALVPRDAVGPVRAAVATWSRERATSCAVTGPWPPFSFCEEADADV